jgi:hypothetical protein
MEKQDATNYYIQHYLKVVLGVHDPADEDVVVHVQMRFLGLRGVHRDDVAVVNR